MNKDWHIHSSYSDSSRSIEEIIAISKIRGCNSISITDHDTFEGTLEALKHNDSEMEVITGIEISTWDRTLNREIHILGYHFNLEATKIKQLCENTLKQRKEIAYKQVEVLKNLGYDISMNDVYQNQKNSTTIYKQHILKVLIEKEVTDQYYGAFYKTMFKNGGPCLMKLELPSIEDAINAIHQDGGIAVLAHPFNSQCIKEIHRYHQLGIDGIETYHSSHNQKEVAICHELALQYKLIETGGSDNHGEYGNEPEIGTCIKQI